MIRFDEEQHIMQISNEKNHIVYNIQYQDRLLEFLPEKCPKNHIVFSELINGYKKYFFVKVEDLKSLKITNEALKVINAKKPENRLHLD
jgi:hypothetical protein